MIVSDTNLMVHLVLGGEHRAAAHRLHARDPEWAAPPLWRSEFRNVLAMQCRNGRLEVEGAIELQRRAERVVEGRVRPVSSERVLHLAAASGCSAYDCEFVALAEFLGVPLVTLDELVLARFPGIAVSLTAIADRRGTAQEGE